VANDDDIGKSEVRDKGRNILAEGGNCPRLSVGSGKPVASEVNGDNAEIFRKGRNLRLPVGLVTHPAVDQHDGGFSEAVDRRGNVDAVGGLHGHGPGWRCDCPRMLGSRCLDNWLLH
jgi:hypothetical protein